MDPRKAFLLSGFVILAWMIFWNVAIRVSAARIHVKRDQEGKSSPALAGLSLAV